MTKTKRQLRAEAVERLMNNELHYETFGDDVVDTLLGRRYGDKALDAVLAICDLLADDEPPCDELITARGYYMNAFLKAARERNELRRKLIESNRERDEWKRKAEKYQKHMWEYSNWHTSTAQLLGIGFDPENWPTDDCVQLEIEQRILDGILDVFKERDEWKA